MSKVWVAVLSAVILIAIIVVAIKFLPTCDLVGSWGKGTIQACKCTGIKITVENSLPVDGQLRNVCLGITSVKHDELTFSGRIVDNDTSCYHDGVCKVKVDNYWIITDQGGDPDPEMEKKRGPHGSIIGIDGRKTGNVGDKVIGNQVEVFAKIVNKNTLTLYGNKDYYIRFNK